MLSCPAPIDVGPFARSGSVLQDKEEITGGVDEREALDDWGVPELKQNSTLLTLGGFVALCLIGSLLPHPREEGELLEVSAAWPEALTLPKQERRALDAPSPSLEEQAPAPVVVAPVIREVAASEPDADDAAWRARLGVVSQENATLVGRLGESLADTRHPRVALELSCARFDEKGQCAGRALDRLFLKLRVALLARSTEPVRWSHLGDSLTAGDSLTNVVRELLQEEFGDGGYGFIPPAPPAPYMVHRGVRASFDGEWDIDTFFKGSSPRDLGVMGASFENPRGGKLRVEERGDEPRFERVGVLYRRAKGAGSVGLTVDGESSSLALEASSAVAWHLPKQPASKVSVRFAADGTTHHGVVFERAGGIAVDNLGIVSSGTRRLRAMEPIAWDRALAARGSDVVVFFFGANIASEKEFNSNKYKRFLKEHADIYAASRGPDGHRDCLVMSILTRGQRSGGKVTRRASVPQLVQLQREAAAQAGCAFWDSHAFLGGELGTQAWYGESPSLLSSDLVHPTQRGYSRLGGALSTALLVSFKAWLEELDPAALIHLCELHDIEGCVEGKP